MGSGAKTGVSRPLQSGRCRAAARSSVVDAWSAKQAVATSLLVSHSNWLLDAGNLNSVSRTSSVFFVLPETKETCFNLVGAVQQTRERRLNQCVLISDEPRPDGLSLQRLGPV